MRTILAAAMLCLSVGLVQAEPGDKYEFLASYQGQAQRTHQRAVLSHGAAIHGDPRPAAWCGWWMRHYLGVTDRAYNLARKWAGYGRRVDGPAPGVIAVWPHHVGVVTGVAGPHSIVLKSGNDGHAVRERERSTRGVIAWRMP